MNLFCSFEDPAYYLLQRRFQRSNVNTHVAHCVRDRLCKSARIHKEEASYSETHCSMVGMLWRAAMCLAFNMSVLRLHS